MYVLLTYWNGKNSSKQKTVITISKTSNYEDEIIVSADELLQEKLNLLDDDDQEITDGEDIDQADLFVKIDEIVGEIIYHKSAGPTGVNEWHVVVVVVEDDSDDLSEADVVSSFVKTLTITPEVPKLVAESVKQAISDEDGENSDIRAVYVSEILQQLSHVSDDSLPVWLEELRKRIEAERG